MFYKLLISELVYMILQPGGLSNNSKWLLYILQHLIKHFIHDIKRGNVPINFIFLHQVLQCATPWNVIVTVGGIRDQSYSIPPALILSQRHPPRDASHPFRSGGAAHNGILKRGRGRGTQWQLSPYQLKYWI